MLPRIEIHNTTKEQKKSVVDSGIKEDYASKSSETTVELQKDSKDMIVNQTKQEENPIK